MHFVSTNFRELTFYNFFVRPNCREQIIGTKKRASKIVLQITNDSQGKCHSWIRQAFAQKSSIGKQ